MLVKKYFRPLDIVPTLIGDVSTKGTGNNREVALDTALNARCCCALTNGSIITTEFPNTFHLEAETWAWLLERGFLPLRPCSPLLRIHINTNSLSAFMKIVSASMSHNIDLEAQSEQQALAVLEEGAERSNIYGGKTSNLPSETKGASGAKPVAIDQQAKVKAPPAISQTAGMAFVFPYRRIAANPLTNRRRGKPNS